MKAFHGAPRSQTPFTNKDKIINLNSKISVQRHVVHKFKLSLTSYPNAKRAHMNFQAILRVGSSYISINDQKNKELAKEIQLYIH
jgi:hypothetical protein